MMLASNVRDFIDILLKNIKIVDVQINAKTYLSMPPIKEQISQK